MNNRLVASLVLVAFAVTPIAAQEMPEMPTPQKEHQWLERLVGEWETSGEIYTEPGQPPINATGSESVRSIGGFWIVGDVKGDFLGQQYNAALTLGYDPEKKKYIGTWVDSMSSYLWQYTGTVDEAGNSLTLESRGPCPKRPGEMANVKEVIEIKDDDTRTFTSSMQEPDGTWTKLMTINYKRKN